MTQAHPFTVDPKQFEACLAKEEMPREPFKKVDITRVAVKPENRLENQAENQLKKIQLDENISLEQDLMSHDY